MCLFCICFCCCLSFSTSLSLFKLDILFNCAFFLFLNYLIIFLQSLFHFLLFSTTSMSCSEEQMCVCVCAYVYLQGWLIFSKFSNYLLSRCEILGDTFSSLFLEFYSLFGFCCSFSAFFYLLDVFLFHIVLFLFVFLLTRKEFASLLKYWFKPAYQQNGCYSHLMQCMSNYLYWSWNWQNINFCGQCDASQKAYCACRILFMNETGRTLWQFSDGFCLGELIQSDSLVLLQLYPSTWSHIHVYMELDIIATQNLFRVATKSKFSFHNSWK